MPVYTYLYMLASLYVLAQKSPASDTTLYNKFSWLSVAPVFWTRNMNLGKPL